MAKIPEAEITRAITRAFALPGLFQDREARMLYRLARRKGQLVEIGAFKGRTSAILQQAAQVWKAHVTSIDPFVDVRLRGSGSPEGWRANLTGQGIAPPDLLVMTSVQAAQTWDAPIALLFIDGDHSYEAVAADLRLWTPHVAVGGIVALHDMYYPRIPGVEQAVHEWWQAEWDDREGQGARWRCLGLVDYLIAFERKR